LDIRWSIFRLFIYCKLTDILWTSNICHFTGDRFLIYPAVVHLVPILHGPLNDHIWTSAGRPIIGRTFWVEAGRSMDILTWTTNNSDQNRTSIGCPWLPENGKTLSFYNKKLGRPMDILWTSCGLRAVEEMEIFLSLERKKMIIYLRKCKNCYISQFYV
jgi:hypothetical protein